MTSLIAWLGVDSRGPASVYIASDSRLSRSGINWDCGRKVFACQNSSDLFGYCGAVLFPSQFLGQLTASIDARVLFPPNSTPDDRLEVLERKLQLAVVDFPEQAPFTIVYATRVGEGYPSSFFIATLSWDRNERITREVYPLPTFSDLLLARGSGKPIVEDYQFNWRHSDIGRTSRAVFSAFCDSISSGRDVATGGPPQLAGLYLRGPSTAFGIIHNGACYLHGMRCELGPDSLLECRNRLFERCAVDGKLIGKRHARPAFSPLLNGQ